jgi:lipoyl(octanoyl) transferase
MPIIVRTLGTIAYEDTLAAMQAATLHRPAHAPDEIWLLEHPPVYTQGLAGRPAHHLRPNAIPVVASDRGGQITYHGPGQWVAYCLVCLARRNLCVRTLVAALEEAVLRFLEDQGVPGARRAGAPGIYVGGAKIAALGLRVRGGWSYHGVALNVDLDLAPFQDINPCGYPGLAVTRLVDQGVVITPALRAAFLRALKEALQMGHEEEIHSRSLPAPDQ